MKVEITKLCKSYHVYDLDSNKELWSTTNKFALFLAIVINGWDVQKPEKDENAIEGKIEES